MAVQTDSLNPPHQYVPWITVNGQYSEADEDAVRTNMLQFVCQTYTGPVKLPACGNQQPMQVDKHYGKSFDEIVATMLQRKIDLN